MEEAPEAEAEPTEGQAVEAAEPEVEASEAPAATEAEPVAEEAAEPVAAGTRFNRHSYGLSLTYKIGLRFHFYSDTCINYQFLSLFLVKVISSQNSSDFSSQNSS